MASEHGCHARDVVSASGVVISSLAMQADF